MNKQYLTIGKGYGLTHWNLDPDRYREFNPCRRHGFLSASDFNFIVWFNLRQPTMDNPTLNDKINRRGRLRVDFKKAV